MVFAGARIRNFLAQRLRLASARDYDEREYRLPYVRLYVNEE